MHVVKPSVGIGGLQSCCLPPLDSAQIERYIGVGRVWGFLKYYHFKVAKGGLDWDAALVKIFEEGTFDQNDSAYHQALRDLIGTAGQFKKGKRAKFPIGDQETRNVDWSWIADTTKLPEEITHYLQAVRSYHHFKKNHYVQKTQYEYRRYILDHSYVNQRAPDVSVRLLGLFQYWNVIWYFYPYKNLAPEPWEDKLYEFIPLFIQAEGRHAYYRVMLQLTKQLKDTHSDFSHSPSDPEIYGYARFPFSFTSLSDTSIWISKIWMDSFPGRGQLKAGDQPLGINGTEIQENINRLTPYIAASNESAFRRNVCSYLPYDTVKGAVLKLKRADSIFYVNVSRLKNDEMKGLDLNFDFSGPPLIQYFGTQGEFLYVNLGRATTTDLDSLIEAIEGSNSIIIDLR
ncbi:MAG: hypothetical protein AAGI38_00800 [Bacteroidota bacterium]